MATRIGKAITLALLISSADQIVLVLAASLLLSEASDGHHHMHDGRHRGASSEKFIQGVHPGAALSNQCAMQQFK